MGTRRKAAFRGLAQAAIAGGEEWACHRCVVALPKTHDINGRRSVLEAPIRSEYDFSQSRKNPYAIQTNRSTDQNVVWDVVTVDLEPLVSRLAKLLSE